MENNINKDVQFNLSEVTDKSEYKKADMTRIVTLNNLSITPAAKDGAALVMDATARTYRYLDPEEVQAQRKAGGKK